MAKISVFSKWLWKDNTSGQMKTCHNVLQSLCSEEIPDWCIFLFIFQQLTTSIFFIKKRRSKRRKFLYWGKKWWHWRSWKRKKAVANCQGQDTFFPLIYHTVPLFYDKGLLEGKPWKDTNLICNPKSWMFCIQTDKKIDFKRSADHGQKQKNSWVRNALIAILTQH